MSNQPSGHGCVVDARAMKCSPKRGPLSPAPAVELQISTHPTFLTTQTYVTIVSEDPGGTKEVACLLLAANPLGRSSVKREAMFHSGTMTGISQHVQTLIHTHRGRT